MQKVLNLFGFGNWLSFFAGLALSGSVSILTTGQSPETAIFLAVLAGALLLALWFTRDQAVEALEEILLD